MEEFYIITLKNGKKYTIRNNREKIFTPEEWNLFYNTLKESQKMTFDFLINTGARINEATHVKVCDIDLINKNICLKVVKKKTKYSDGNQRTIPISTEFRDRLKEYITKKGLKDNDYLKLLSRPAGHIAMKNALKRSGFKDWHMFSLHNIRKSFETWIVSQNVGMLKVLKHMGHTDKTALKYYIKSDLFSKQQRVMIKQQLGDLYKGDGLIDELYDRINNLELKLRQNVDIATI